MGGGIIGIACAGGIIIGMDPEAQWQGARSGTNVY